MGKLGSDCETERAPAARLADEHRKKCRLTWDEIILAAPDAAQLERKPRKPQKPTSQAKAKGVVKSVLATEWERNFAQGLLARWHGPLTEKQTEVLERVWTKCCGRDAQAA